ncbi:MAG: hypothetical protein FJ148_27580 [Deltaproteobacteria bacterium]|nr:hypothetical protein [Deltaproteobacteria bacterium]
MSKLVQEAKEKLCSVAQRAGFRDPVTGLVPKCEVQLSATLALYHQLGLVDWGQVLLEEPDGSLGHRASQAIPTDSVVATEFPLATADQGQVEIWGGMPADVLFLSRDGARVALLESKIGSGFTYGADPEKGQVGRQIDFLRSTRPSAKSYILLTSGRLLDRGWYRNELAASAQYGRRESVGVYLMRWESVMTVVTPLSAER